MVRVIKSRVLCWAGHVA